MSTNIGDEYPIAARSTRPPEGPAWPVSFTDVLEAQRRIQSHILPSPLRSYPQLDNAVGGGIRLWVKHENHNPTNSFKVRNGLAVLTALSEEQRKRGVVAATRGNHGLGLAWAGMRLGVPVTICVPVGNNPEKNEAIRGLGATLVEEGRDYDEAVAVAAQRSEREGLRIVHSTNDRAVIAGAATLTLEMLQEVSRLDAIVVGVGGGSMAVGAMVVTRALRPEVRVFGVQAEGAAAIHDAWHSGVAVPRPNATTFADGLATRNVYEQTFPALQAGLSDFVTVSDAEIAEAMRMLMRSTHNMVEGAGAAGLAGVMKMRPAMEGLTIGIVLSGANIDESTLRRVLTREI